MSNILTFNKKRIWDKIYGCWTGKNIGGTMGTPYENTQELLDIHGFATAPGEVLPNDDLDLQLVWLRAMDEMGPEAVNERVLGEYWLTYICPAWNEYGIGKSNLREGLQAPLSGEVYNEKWKNSNGAWIRTEIWACLFPGSPEKAIRYAFYDACVDHGYNEGTYAAIFVAAMESAAFVFSDINTLLEIGLSKIPSDCRMAKAVRLVMDEYAKGTDWKVTRELLIEQSADIGWFQAPANVGFVVLGMLYGQGDFKKSMILAINCGDDTDCTGATIGAIMGIMKGTEGIPADWRSYIGDKIITCCNTNGHGAWPATCTDLTDRVMEMLPTTNRIHRYYNGFYGNSRNAYQQETIVTFGDEDDFSAISPESYLGNVFVQDTFANSHYTIHETGIYADVLVELEHQPEITPLGTISGRINIKDARMQIARQFHLRWFLPEGWSVSCKSFVPALEPLEYNNRTRLATAEFTITAGEKVDANNRLVLEVSSESRPSCVYVPIVLLG